MKGDGTMSATAERQLLEFLDRGPSADRERLRAAGLSAASGGDPAKSTLDGPMVASMRAQLIADPERMLAEAPAVLGDRPSIADGMRLLNDAEAALRTRVTPLPPSRRLVGRVVRTAREVSVSGYDSKAVPIRPSEKRFESLRTRRPGRRRPSRPGSSVSPHGAGLATSGGPPSTRSPRRTDRPRSRSSRIGEPGYSTRTTSRGMWST